MNNEDNKPAVPSAAEIEAKAKADAEAKAKAESQDLLKSELEKVQKKGEGRTKREKLVYTKNRIDEQLAELDEEEGIKPSHESEDDDDSKPFTIGDYKKLVKKEAVQTAIQLADEIADPTEKELTKYHILNSIKSTGNPKEDLFLATSIVNASKNAKIAEEIARKGKAKTHSAGSSAPSNDFGEQEQELSPDELAFTKPPFNMSKADILKARR